MKLKVLPKLQFSHNWVSQIRKNPQILVFAIFAINLLLVSSTLTPPFWQINPHDEAKYIESGRRLLDFQIRDMAWGPLVALVYAPLHLIFGNSFDWFIIEAWGGRIILYAMMWWSTYYLGTRFKGLIADYALLGILFVATPFSKVVINQSDALFVCCSSLALAKVIDYYHFKRQKDVVIGSIFVALAALCRAEALLLLPIYVIAIVLQVSKPFPPSKLIRLILTSLIPAISILGVYVFFYWLSNQTLDLGFGYKSYDSFEWNQSVLTGGDLQLARQEARRLFGTPEENNYSVIRAILRNPPAFGQRIWANLKTLPDNFFELFSKRLGLITLVMFVLGGISLLSRYPFSVSAVLILWSLQPFVALGFLALHIVPQISHIILVITAIGVTSLFTNSSPINKWFILTSLIGIGLIGILRSHPALISTSLVIGGTFLLGWLMSKQMLLDKATPWLFLIGALILKSPFQDLFIYPPIGETPEEQAIHYIQENFPPYSTIAVATPRLAIAAKMNDVDFEVIPDDTMSSPDSLRDWLVKERIYAVVYTPAAAPFSRIFEVIEQNLDHHFQRVFYSNDLSVQIYIPIPKSD